MKKIATFIILLCITAYCFQGELFFFFMKIPIVEALQFNGLETPFEEDSILYKAVPQKTKWPLKRGAVSPSYKSIIANNIKLEIPDGYDEYEIVHNHTVFAKSDSTNVVININPLLAKAVNQISPNLPEGVYKTHFIKDLEKTFNKWKNKSVSEKVISMYLATPSSITHSIPPDVRALNLNLLALKAVSIPLGFENGFRMYKVSGNTILLSGPRIYENTIHSYYIHYFQTIPDEVSLSVNFNFSNDISEEMAEELVHHFPQKIRCSKVQLSSL